MSLMQDLTDKAGELGMGRIGAVRPEAMEGYAERVDERARKAPLEGPVYEGLKKLSRTRELFPEARSVIVAALHMGHYRIPGSLLNLVGKHYLVDLRNNPLSPEQKMVAGFGEFLEKSGVRYFRDEGRGAAPMRWAAQEAGLGRIRKNNFLYTENGSWIAIYAWLADRELEQVWDPGLPPCPESCGKCMESCPTGSLFEPFAMALTSCVSFLTGLHPSATGDDALNEALGSWIYGCDACQDACPFNKGKWREEDEFPELEKLAEYLLPERLLALPLSEIKRLVSPKLFYIKDESLYKWKVNAINVIVNTKRRDLAGALSRAAEDPHPEVRKKALWALEKLKARAFAS